MVKIVNELGEVKKGVQGEAVYQGRYGQQIRRTRQPKRAIPSQKQLEHRQLYREALTWRKGLSLPNRRYLDGYCIANWIVDDYKIALPWSRFALKLYLQHISFVIVEKPILAYLPIYEEHTEEQPLNDTQTYFSGTAWPKQGQRLFIPNRKVTKLAFILRKNNAPTGDVTFTIRKVINDTIITSKVWGDASALPTVFTEVEVEFETPPTINEEARICCEFYGGGGAINIGIRYQNSDVKADECKGVAENSVWTDSPARDLTYRYTYLVQVPGQGEIDWSKTKLGLLHVRHPALLSGEHRRNGKLLEEWTNLSNLDEEYITGQVGVDVFPGDELKFATIAGVEYSLIVP